MTVRVLNYNGGSSAICICRVPSVTLLAPSAGRRVPSVTLLAPSAGRRVPSVTLLAPSAGRRVHKMSKTGAVR